MTRGRIRRVGALALLVALATTACAGGVASPEPARTPEPTTPASPLADTRWEVADLDGAPPAADSTLTAAFGADGALTGSGGCNRFTTRYSTTGTEIRLDAAVASTMIACDEAVMAQEAVFLTALGTARTFALAADRLTLSDEAGRALVAFSAQSQELAGTWQVLGYHDGASAVVSPVEGTTPTFEFTDDSVSGTAGCNRLNSGYTVDGTAIKLGPFMSTRMACAEPAGVMEQEAALVAALESAATVSVEGDNLELRRADGATAARLKRG